MKVRGIRRISQISQHLYEIREEIEAEDIIKVIRFLAKEEKDLLREYYEQGKILYRDQDLSKEEFNLLLKKTRENSLDIHNILDSYFLREEIISKIKGLIKVKNSITKTAAIDRIVNDTELLFNAFREKIIEKKSLSLEDFCNGKTLISVGNKDKVVFEAFSPYGKAISGKIKEQFWKLSWGDDKHVSDYNSRLYSSFLFINLKDSDEKIMKMLKEIPATDKELELKLYVEEIKEKDLKLSLPEVIFYPIDIDRLSSYFGKRHASKFETFASGLEKKADEGIVSKLLGKRFLLTPKSSNKLYLGKPIDKETFEKIASYLSLEYLDDQNIICKLQEKKTREVISALWEICGKTNGWSSAEIGKSFYLVRLD